MKIGWSRLATARTTTPRPTPFYLSTPNPSGILNFLMKINQVEKRFRQKMVGMMYLVLTALLALNVSNTVIDKFVFLNESSKQLSEKHF